MQLKFPAKSFSAWVPLSDLEAWYWESVGRARRYSTDILQSTSSSDGILNVAEARKRSPLFMPYPEQLREGAGLHIYTGIHDGYTGSVPIVHSINMYNKIVREKYPNQPDAIVPQDDILKMSVAQCFPNAPQERIGERKLHYHRQTGDVELVVFEGGHEQIEKQAIGLIPLPGQIRHNKITFLTLGDSNAASEYGWALQLGMICPYATVVNRSLSGKCVGISNLNNEKLNSLLTIDTTLQKINDHVDYIIIGLGTNDAKLDYDRRTGEFPANVRTFIKKIKNSELYRRCTPRLVILSCPPLDESLALPKYAGATARLKKFNRALAKTAKEEDAVYVDVQSLLASPSGLLSAEIPAADGVHLTPKAARIVAEGIIKTTGITKAPP
jgi:lysophospholipase L1-like esterase